MACLVRFRVPALALAIWLGSVYELGSVAAAEPVTNRPIVEALQVEPHPCLTASALAAEVAKAMEKESLDARASTRIAPAGDGVDVTVAYEGVPRGIRHIKAEPRCSDYVGVVAITVAMALDALVPRGEPPPQESTNPEPHEEPTPPVPAVAPSAKRVAHPRPVRPPPRKAWRPSVRVTAELASNLLPAWSGGFGTAVSMRRTPNGPRLRLGMNVLFPEHVAFAGGSIRASALTGDAVACLTPLARLRALRFCGGGIVGFATARGTGSGLARDVKLPLVHASLGIEASLPLGRGFAVLASADALAAIVRPEFVVIDENGGTVASRPGIVGALLRLGLEWDAP